MRKEGVRREEPMISSRRQDGRGPVLGPQTGLSVTMARSTNASHLSFPRLGEKLTCHATTCRVDLRAATHVSSQVFTNGYSV